MGTKIWDDIQSDLTLLIKNITGFEDSSEGLKLCEKFVLSNIKHHRFLSVNNFATEKLINDIHHKYMIYGMYDVAKEFHSLVEYFLISIKNDKTTQYDLQWSLLSLVFSLSNDSSQSKVFSSSSDSLLLSLTDYSKQTNNDEDAEQITDWKEYLKSNDLEFFNDFQSSSESEWSEEESEEPLVESQVNGNENNRNELLLIENKNEMVLIEYTKQVEHRKWMDANIENTWWNNINWHEFQVQSNFLHAHFCKIFNNQIERNEMNKVVSTISEYQACREIIWMFHLPIEMILYNKGKNNNYTFCVRENLSIPSLTCQAFKSAFSFYNKYFLMIKKLNSFENLLKLMYDNDKYPPLTYEIYNATMKEFLKRIKLNLVNIEENIIKQNTTTTFLTLTNDLYNDLMFIELLYDINKLVTKFKKHVDYSKKTNWEKSLILLSNIYYEIENSTSIKRTNICVTLYLSTLRVYLNIIDIWLSQGRLEDFRNEFSITKILINKKKSFDCNEKNYKINFKIRQVDKEDPIMKTLVKKVYDMSKSIEIIITLDKISELMSNVNAKSSTSISLNDEFINEIIENLSKYSNNDNNGTINEFQSNYNEDFYSNNNINKNNEEIKSKSFDLENNIRQQILKINNPFLMKAFQNDLPLMNLHIDNQVENYNNNIIIDEKNWGINLFDKLEKISQYILPFSKIIQETIDKILNKRYSCASNLVKDILINEYKLNEHIKLMRYVYMMEKEHVIRKFYQQMFNQIENNSLWINSYDLTDILQDVLSDEWRDINYSHNPWSVIIKDKCTHQILQLIDNILINYSIDWPINMILTEQILNKYNDIFKFQLKLKWALWTLNYLNFSNLDHPQSINKSKINHEKDDNDIFYHFYSKRLKVVRFWLLHAIGSISSYLSSQVFPTLTIIFDKSLSQANTLHNIIQIHHDYLEKIYEHCLLTPQFSDIMSTINELLAMCATVKNHWQQGIKQIIPSQLDLIESTYIKHHTYLALALHNAVQHKQADYLTALSSAFNCSIPCNTAPLK